MAVKKASDRLKVVLKLAQIKQRQAAERLAEATRSMDAHLQQAKELNNYRGEYNQQFHDKAQGQLNASNVRNFQRFYSQLDEAVETQYRRSDVSAQQLEFHRNHWQKEYGREKNMERLIEDKQLHEEKALDKKLQLAMDELSVRPKNSIFD